MPQVAYNYQTYLDLFRRMISGNTASTDAGRYSAHYVATLLDEALDRIQERMRWVRPTTNWGLTNGFNVVNGQYTYLNLFHQSENEVAGIINFPAVLGTSISSIRLIGTDGTIGDELTRIPWAQMLKDYPDAANETAGTPAVWSSFASGFIADSTVLIANKALANYPHDPANSIIIMPPPDWSKTNGIAIVYHGRGFPLERIWNPGSDVTIGYTAGEATVAFSATYFGNLRVGDELGIVRTSGESPRVWYRITDTTYTAPATFGAHLDNHIVEATDAAAEFIVAQVPDLERSQPGRMGFAPVWLALANEIKMSNYELSQKLESDAWGWLNQLPPDEDFRQVAGPATYDTPFFNSNR